MNPHFGHFQKLSPFLPIPAVGVGVLLLFLGRKLFWLFVGAIGFVVGAEVAAATFPHQPDWAIICGLALGLIGAIAAILVQKIAVAIGGFLAGGYFLMTLLQASQLQPPELSWVSFLIGGALGAILMIYVFDWALIIFSSISGAHLIVHSFPLTQQIASVAFFTLIVIGILAQRRMRASATKAG